MQKVKLDDLIIDAGTQARACISVETVEQYAERMTEGDDFPPIVVYHDGSSLYIGDGFHRVLASERCGFIEIMADVRKGTHLDALWYAVGANKANGQRMSRGDIRHAVEVALKTWPEKTQQEIAAQVGCSQRYIGKIMEVIRTSSNHSIPETRVNAQGRTRPTTYTRKESTNTETETETQEEETSNNTQEGKPKRTKPCMGLQFARLAIMDLEQIQKNDTERAEAFQKVRNWIDENDK